MDELSVWKARVLILEKQMEETNAQLREFIEAFEEFRRYTRPFIPQPLEQQEAFGGPVAKTPEDMEWDYSMAMGIDDDDLS